MELIAKGPCAFPVRHRDDHEPATIGRRFLIGEIDHPDGDSQAARHVDKLFHRVIVFGANREYEFVGEGLLLGLASELCLNQVQTV